MNRTSKFAWALYVVPIVAVGMLCARRHRRLKGLLEGMQRTTRAIDANLSAIKRLREASLRVEQSAAEPARVKSESVDFAVVAKHLQPSDVLHSPGIVDCSMNP